MTRAHVNRTSAGGRDQGRRLDGRYNARPIDKRSERMFVVAAFPIGEKERDASHTNLYWTYQTTPGRTAGTVETKDVDFGGTS
jgi:hypothetical protein